MLGKVQFAVAQHFTLLNTIVWDKVDPGLGWRWRRTWEAIIEASLGKPRVWNGGTDARNVLRFAKAILQSDQHPTPKPVPLLEEIIKAAAPSRGSIPDLFAGSGPHTDCGRADGPDLLCRRTRATVLRYHCGEVGGAHRMPRMPCVSAWSTLPRGQAKPACVAREIGVSAVPRGSQAGSTGG